MGDDEASWRDIGAGGMFRIVNIQAWGKNLLIADSDSRSHMRSRNMSRAGCQGRLVTPLVQRKFASRLAHVRAPSARHFSG
jgi:hypothetical protein